MRKVTTTYWQSENGMKFSTEEDCIGYEKFYNTDDKIMIAYVNKFLDNIDNYSDWSQEYITDENKHLCVNIYSDGDLTILDSREEDSLEVDESFSIDMDKWRDFSKGFKKEFGYECSIDMYYWSK